MQKKRVLICGHTGATGGFLLDRLVNADWVSEIVTVGRRNCDKYDGNSKVKQIIISDMTDLSGIAINEIGSIDIAYDLVATNLSEAFNGADYYRIADVNMATEFARLAKEVGAKFIGGICQKGSEEDKDYGKDYSRQAKHDFMVNVQNMEFERNAFLMPAWVAREQGKAFLEFIYTMGGLNGVKASAMAECLIWAALNQKEKVQLYSEKDIKNISKGK